MARTMQHMNDQMRNPKINKKACFGPQYMLQKGLKMFGDKGYNAAKTEIGQLHDRVCFRPLNVSKLTPTEKSQAMEALMFLTEKRPDLEGHKKVKGRMVYNGKPTREWLN